MHPAKLTPALLSYASLRAVWPGMEQSNSTKQPVQCHLSTIIKTKFGLTPHDLLATELGANPTHRCLSELYPSLI